MPAQWIVSTRQPCASCGATEWVGPDKINGQQVCRCAHCDTYALWQTPWTPAPQALTPADAKGRPPLAPVDHGYRRGGGRKALADPDDPHGMAFKWFVDAGGRPHAAPGPGVRLHRIRSDEEK